mmetsp:Transcript_119976/g.373657  ORF Transcript_119976/g.373657 Transcript_119976/m.373657 type:complete len:200 (+) Transcript_119976:124-723(+)
MAMVRCLPDEAFSAYFCVMLFDSIGYELHAQDLQEVNGSMGLGIYCTLDLERAQATSKEVLIAEFWPTPSDGSRSGASELLVVAVPGDAGGDRWRQRGYSGVLFGGTELCLRVECLRALYRREWRQPPTAWMGLQRLVSRMRDPPLAIDSETSQTDASWAKALERLKTYGDKRVLETRERLEPVWRRRAEPAGGGCSVS